MKCIKKLLVALSVFLVVTTSLTVNLSAENYNISPTDGKAYAVLNGGDLIFFRSYESYDNEQLTGIFTDIYGNQYIGGSIFINFEEYSFYSFEDIREHRWISDDYKDKVKKVYVAPNQIIAPKTMASWFWDCSNLISFNGRGFDTSNVIDMSYMFGGCESLTSLDISNFDTSNVINMHGMFYHCKSLTSLDLSNFNTSNVTDTSAMFFCCSSLTSLDLSNFNTSKVTDMSSMFSGCSSLELLDLSKLNTSNVTDMNSMFDDCSSLTSLDLSSFDTSKVTYMNSMFYDCSSLSEIKIGRNFTKWLDHAYLPKGSWGNKTMNLIKSEKDLYNDYPKNASKWNGEWIKMPAFTDTEACSLNGKMHLKWREDNGKKYWCEKGITQGKIYQKGNVWYDGIERGREIYDPASNGWYWLDAVYNGAKAENKEVFMPYIYQDENLFTYSDIDTVANESNTYTEDPKGITANMGEQIKKAILNKTGKWVRYDAYGKMIKGWYTVQGDDARIYSNQIGNTYYYDYQTGLMAKGETIIGGRTYYFDETTGVLQK